MPDTRKHDRVLLPLEARWEGLSGRHTARISDLSLGGCYIETLGQVTIGEEISFDIQLPTQNWMPLRGKVIYHFPNMGFGVQFLDLSELESNVLENLIEYARQG
jgi:hypothetical protein